VSTPKTSAIRKLYESYTQPFTKVVHGIPTSWDSNPVARVCPSIIKLAVWSSCSQFIAISSQNSMVVDILDSMTLQKVQTLKLKDECYPNNRALSFSPDSHMLTSGHFSTWPFEAFVVTWDLQTGGIISAINKSLNVHYPTNTFITYSTNGKMVGILYQDYFTFIISIYNVVSGVHMQDVYHYTHNNPTPYHLPDFQYWCNIWTQGGSLRFATTTPMAITIWEVRFALGATLTRVDTISIPNGVGVGLEALPKLYPQTQIAGIQFHPASCRLALLYHKTLGGILVWDVQESKSLLHCMDVIFYPRMSFSSDGCFFACSTVGSQVYLWKESSTGYSLHGILTPNTQDIIPFLSPNGELIFVHGHEGLVAKLWYTKSLTTTPSTTLTQAQKNENFILEFLPDRSLAAVARQGDNRVMVLDLKSGVQQLTIDVGMEVHGIMSFRNTVAVVGEERVAWYLQGSAGWVTSGEEVEVTLDYQTPIIDIEYRQQGSSRRSSHGYQVTDDGWIISSNRKRLLMLPPHWQSNGMHQMWNGRILVLLHGALPEPIVLEVEPSPVPL
jgi:WD40 repeat protein